MNRNLKNRARYYGACSIAALAGVLAATPAAAQSQPAGLEEVVVTARKVAENLQDVPVAVTAFSGDDLQKQNALKITDIGRLTPGIMFRQSSTNPSGLLVMMRGQFQRDTTGTQDPSVGTYVDGVYWARSYGLNAELVDLQSAQILKGPQGTLFGRNTTGGAVLLQTNDPQYDRISGMVSGTYGRFNERAITGVLNLPIITDRVAVRGALQISKRDGYIHDYITGREYEDRDNITGRVKLGVQATDDLSIVLSAEKYEFNQNGQVRTLFLAPPATDAARGATSIWAAERGPRGGLTLPAYIAFTTANKDLTGQDSDIKPLAPLNNVPDAHYETETYTGTGAWDTGIGTFKLVGAYRGVKGSSSLDLEGSPWSFFTTIGYSDIEQYSAELQLTGKTFGEALSYVGGAFWFKEEGLDGSTTENFSGGQASTSALVRANASARSANDAYIENKSTGAYGQLTWRATDRLNFTGGLRYSVDDRGVAMNTRTYNTTTLAVISCNHAALGAVVVGNTCTPVSRSDTFKSSSYLASVDYKFTDGVMGYAKYSKGYRSGGQNGRALTPLILSFPFAPETVHEAEIGIKSELFDRRLRLNMAAYRSTIDGAQRALRSNIPVGNPPQIQVVTVYTNAAKVRVTGFEAEATAVLGNGFKVSLSGATTSPEYLSYPSTDGLNHKLDRFNGVPEYQASFLASYDREIGTAALSLQADYSWASETALDESNNPADPLNAQILAATTRPAGGELNARASVTFQDGRYSVAAYGKNILNNRDRTSALLLNGTVGGQWHEPATFGIQGTYRFGQ